MTIAVLNQDFEIVKYMDVFDSLIWTERYNDEGDFELVLKVDESDDLSYLAFDNYLRNSEMPDNLMIIEDIDINKSYEEGIVITVTGRSLESILGRRLIIKGAEARDTQISNVIWSIFMQNIISPSISARRIPEMTYEIPSSIGNRLIGIDYETLENFEDTIKNICHVMKIGFKVVFDEENKKFITKFYEPKKVGIIDDQGFTDGAIFSESYDNVMSLNSFTSNKDVKNAVLGHLETTFNITKIVDDQETTVVKNFSEVVSSGEGSGLLRREAAFDCPDIEGGLSTKDDPTGGAYDWLYQQAMRYLQNKTDDEYKINKDYQMINIHDGEVVIDNPYFQLNKDYFLGDIIIIKDLSYISRKQVTEVIWSYANNEKRLYCSFEEI